MSGPSRMGKVYFVGAGPGDPRLITLRGVECLREADVVLYDYLVDPALLTHSPAGAERFCLEHHIKIDEICGRMLAAALQGKTVVRLKGGDPAVFGRLAEEIDVLRGADVPFEIVPGVTAGLAAAAFAELPVTHAHRASAVALITGHERKDKSASSLDYAALARFPGTLVFYMGVSTAQQWSEALIREGKSPETPVVIVRRCSWPDQTVLRCRLKETAEVVASQNVRPPAVILVGDVADV